MLTLIIVCLLVGCGKEPIKVGFIGDLSSKNSQFSIDARNAVELYFKILNENGGINGKQVKLVIKDSGDNNESAILEHEAFKNEGIKYVIGNQTSGYAESLQKSSSEELLFVSPSMGTNNLNDVDDYIIRCVAGNKVQGDLFHEIMENSQFKNVTVVYDLSNSDYTQSMYNSINELNDNKSYNLTGIAYDTRKDDIWNISDEVIQTRPDVVLLISQAMDSAIFTQNIREANKNLAIYSVSWSMTNEFIQYSGHAGEGVIFIGTYFPKNNSEEANKFNDRFASEYGYSPSFISIYAYDAAMVLTEGIKASPSEKPIDVKRAILDKGTFAGLEAEFSINKYGDGDKGYLLYKLKNGEFVPMWEEE